jgi:hydroxyethylthiazole kinase-like uncharacterized protein yjeF
MTLQALAFSYMNGWLKPRAKDANKGSFGHVLIIGGDYGMPGAVRLAAEGALSVGAGLVTVITRPEHVTAVVSGRPELLCYGLETPEDEAFKTCLAHATMLVLGPGLGQNSWSERLFDAVCEQSTAPLLIDADGLNWLAKKQVTWKPRAKTIFTPHPGEAARLLNITITEVQADRVKAIKALQTCFGGVFVLKGADSLVCTDREEPRVCHAGNPGMASAGMGDLLSGLISGLVAQGLTPWQATQMGVLLHAKAGDVTFKKQGGPGLLALDLLPAIHDLLLKC